MHGPAFIVVPNDATISPPDAWIQGPNSYTVDLKSMDGADDSNTVDFWMNNDHIHRSNLRIGYVPLLVLRHGHSPPSLSTYDDMFCLNVWSRTGQALRRIEPQFNDNNQELCPGSYIDFNKHPPHLLPDNVLSFWLAVRGILTNFTNREQILSTVERVRNLSVERLPLPMMLRRGGGGYSTFVVLAPKGGSVEWSTKDDMLSEIRKNIPVIDDELFTAIFGKRNNTRKRIMLHLKSGSFDVENLRVTHGLKDNLDPTDHDLLVITAVGAPSQRLSSKDMYDVTIALKKVGDGPYKFLPAPASRCTCPVGEFFCAHRGALLMVLRVIMTNNTWNFDTLLNKMPEPIHTIASLPVPVAFAFPHRYTDKTETKRRKVILKELFPSEDWAVDEEDDDNDDHEVVRTVPVANPLSNYPVSDVSQSIALPVCNLVDIWIEGIQKREEETGNAHRISVKLTEEAMKSCAMPNTCPIIEKRNLLRLNAIQRLTEQFPEERSMLSVYCDLTQNNRNERLLELVETDGSFASPDIDWGNKY